MAKIIPKDEALAHRVEYKGLLNEARIAICRMDNRSFYRADIGDNGVGFGCSENFRQILDDIWDRSRKDYEIRFGCCLG